MVKDKNYYKNVFSPLSSIIRKKKFIGFDVETYNDNNEQVFYFGSLYHDNGDVNIIFSKQEFIKILLNYKNMNYYVVATNLSFDFSSIFYNSSEWNNFKFIYRGSDLLLCTYSFTHKSKQSKINFIDTLNYASMSVKQLGKIIGVDKLDPPSYMGKRKSKSIDELKYFILYNIRDSEISKKFMDFFQDGVNEIGGEVKLTSASTSMNIFRKSFQKFKLVQEHCKLNKDKKEIKDFLFHAYYGGRTEVFKKGKLYNLNYYDINSLYPSVMLKSLPNPNTVFIPDKVSQQNIICYEGVTYCHVIAPDDLNIPLLPYKDKVSGKLIFPLGKWYGHYNNIELREAIKLGYVITPIKQILYRKTFKPFNYFIKTLYEKRLYYKSINSSMELITKLIMNSLYGKFAQRTNTNVDIKVLNSLAQKEYEDLLLYNLEYDVKENIAIKTHDEEFNGVHSFPILSSYITSLARLELYSYLNKYNVVYCDTDSIVTYDSIESSKELGKMKYEGFIKSAEFFKPKMYYMQYIDKTDVKIKGISKPSMYDIEKIKNSEIIKRNRISKIRGSVRSGINPNTIIDGSKMLSLQDDKRQWNNNVSHPLIIDMDGKINM